MTKKFKVVLEIEISEEKMLSMGEELPDPIDYICSELGWASQSFDEYSIQEINEIS